MTGYRKSASASQVVAEWLRGTESGAEYQARVGLRGVLGMMPESNRIEDLPTPVVEMLEEEGLLSPPSPPR